MKLWQRYRQKEKLRRFHFNQEDYEDAVKAIREGKDQIRIYFGLCCLRKSQVKNYGIVKDLVRIVKTEKDRDILYEASCLLLDLCNGTQKQVLHLIQNTALDGLREMIIMQDEEISKFAINTLVNWAIKSASVRDSLVQEDTHTFIIDLLPDLEEGQMVNDCLIFLCNLFRKHPMMEDQYVKAIIPGLITYLKWLDDTLELETILEMEGLGIEDEDIFQTSKENTRKDITISILWALSFLPERKICKLCMLDEDLMLLVLKCFRESKNPYLRLPALRFLGNVCSDDDILAKKLMVDYNFAEALKTSIKDKKTFLRKETCWVASNIVCGPMSNIFLVMKNLLEDICHMYLYDTPQIMEEASCILLNCTQKINERTIECLCKADIIDIFAKKIEQEKLNETQEDIILTFLEEFLKKTMRFPPHKEIKTIYRESKVMEFIKEKALTKSESSNGIKAYDILARYFRDIKEELFPK